MISTPKRADLQKALTDPRTVAAFEALFAAVNAMSLPGDIVYSGAATRAGALAADGSLVSRTVYANLFGAIGTTFGIGDGSTTFQLPTVAAVGGCGAFIVY